VAEMLQALYYTLANTDGITDLTALAPDGSTEGVYMAGDVQQGATMPYLVLQQIGNTETRHQGGTSNLDVTRVQITAVAATALAAYTLKEAVRTALGNYRGDMGETGSTVAVRRVFHENDMHLPSPPTDGGQRAPHEWMVDFIVYHVTT